MASTHRVKGWCPRPTVVGGGTISEGRGGGTEDLRFWGRRRNPSYTEKESLVGLYDPDLSSEKGMEG